MFKDMTTAAKLIALAIIAAVIAVLLLWHFWSALHGEKVNARVDQGQAAAVSNASVSAISTLGNNADRATAIGKTAKDGTDEIHEAPAGNSNDAAERASCGMRSYRDSGRCRQLRGAGTP